MKKYFVIMLCIAVIGCGVQNRFARKTQLESDREACAYGAQVPHDVAATQREHYINDIAVPACLRAKGYQPEDLP